MSRALNIDAGQDEVIAACAKHDAPISTIETLPGGCIRVVLKTADAAATVQRHFAKKVVAAPLARTPLATRSRGIPRTLDGAPGRQSSDREFGGERKLWPRLDGRSG